MRAPEAIRFEPFEVLPRRGDARARALPTAGATRLIPLQERSRDTRATRRATCPQAGASERAGYCASLGTKPDLCVIRTLRHRKKPPRLKCLRVWRRPEFLRLQSSEGPGEKRVRLHGGAAL